MSTAASSRRWWLAIVPIAIILVVVAAAIFALRPPGPPAPGSSALAAAATASACPTGSADSLGGPSATPCGGPGGGGGAVGGVGGAGGGGSSNTGPGTSNAVPTPATTPEPTPSPSDTPTPGPMGGPYSVKQTQVLGGETISGFACSASRPFNVAGSTSKVSWVMTFVPKDGARGTWSYAYSIPSAGETHSASGTYTISVPGADGVLHLSMTGRDVVAFHGFNGPIPFRYRFDLVPAAIQTCPG